MREIKFRAYIKKEKVTLPVLGLDLFIDRINCGDQRHKGYNEDFVFSDIELMQYTGLKDKNGKEIYEGDIIESGHNALGIVRWRYFGFEQDMVNTDGWWVIQEDGEVIGNIYENPELIENI